MGAAVVELGSAAGLKFRDSGDIRSVIWDKLFINISFNTIAALTHAMQVCHSGASPSYSLDS